jgi:hypothetical protein
MATAPHTFRRLTPRRGLVTLAVLGALALIVHGTVFSGASFTFLTSNPGNTVTAGTYWFESDKDGDVIVNAAGLRPGGSLKGTVTVTGHGDLGAEYVLSTVLVTDTPATPALSAALRLLVEDVTGAPVERYNGTVAALTNESLGAIATGESRTFDFTLSYPAAAALPGHQGATMTAVLRVTGVAQ